MRVNRSFLRAFVALLCFAMLFPAILSACQKDTAPDPIAESEQSGTEAVTEEEKETQTEIPERGETKVLEVTWKTGQMVSDYSNKTPGLSTDSTTNKLHQYSEVITVPKAGTLIQFLDASPDFTSRFTYVISSWKEVGDGIWQFDPTGTNISGSDVSESPIARPIGTPTRTAVSYEYVTSRDNESIRLCCLCEAPPTVYITENAGVGTYTEYQNFIEESKKESYNQSLQGITLALFGDSYLGGNKLRKEYTWATMLADKYDMTLYNHAIGGSTVSDKVVTNTPLVQRWNNESGTPNIIVVEGGRNDSNPSLNIPIGTNSDTTTHTFKGALIFMLKNLREKYPNAMIVGITAFNSPDRAATIEYARAMQELFAAYGFPCIFSADPTVSGVDTGNAAFRDQYMEMPSDYSHLNYSGHRMALPYFEKALAAYYKDFLAGRYDEKPLPDTSENPSAGDLPYTGTISTTWNTGFIGSDKMTGGQDWTLVSGVAAYSYTNVFTVAKAGTTIYFTDRYDTEYQTPNTVFLFSSWKLSGSSWVIDQSATNIRSDQANTLATGTNYIVWSYTTTKDNEAIRICLRSQSDNPLPTIYYQAPAN